jgi:hypothetical protein
LLVSLNQTKTIDKIDDYNNNNNNNNNKISTLMYGYILAAINVILDSVGSLLTKQYGKKYNTLEINY